MTKDEQIIRAAAGLFLAQGYGGTSMDAIAREAGVAKQTLYSRFNNKNGLFSAIIRHSCAAAFEGLPAAGDPPGLPEYLTQFGERMLGILFGGEALNLYRLVVAEAPRFPELGQIYYEQGPQSTIRGLTNGLSAYGITRVEARLAAEQFLGLLTGHLLTRALLNADGAPSSREKAVYVREAVTSIFKARALSDI